MVKTAVLLERNVTGVVTEAAAVSRGLAVKVCVVLPVSRETAVAGERPMLAGTGKEVALVGLPLLQPVRVTIKPTIMKTHPTRTNANDLPMHPPRPA
jgi:hypothetical protein